MEDDNIMKMDSTGVRAVTKAYGGVPSRALAVLKRTALKTTAKALSYRRISIERFPLPQTDKIWLLVMLLMLAASFAAPRVMAQVDDACKADIEKLCKNVEPGEDRIMKCLKENEVELSAACKAVAETMKAEKQAINEPCPCVADRDKFCKNAKGSDRNDCMNEHEKDFSEACRAKRAERREKVMKNHPCLADIEKFCKDIKQGKGRMMKCLKKYEAELSGECKVVWKKMKAGGKEGMKNRR